MLNVPKVILNELERRARERGISVDEYLADLVFQDPDLVERSKKYAKASLELLDQAENELVKGNLRQAGEKIWGATALIIKAHALIKVGRRLTSHRELWEYKNELAKEIGDWVIVVFQQASSMHINFYENWATKKDIEKALDAVRKLVKTLVKIIEGK